MAILGGLEMNSPVQATDVRQEIDTLLLDLLAIPGSSGKEAGVVAHLRKELVALGVNPSWIHTDDAHLRTDPPGSAGNLIVRLPGSLILEPVRMFIAHLDTLPGCATYRPSLFEEDVLAATPGRGPLGADNRAGVGVLLTTIKSLMRDQVPHPPLTFVFTVQEEVGQQGARHLDFSALGAPMLSFNFDGGRASKLTIGSIGKESFKAVIHGISAHAGLRPEDGASAIVAAAQGINALHEAGLLGSVIHNGHQMSTNIGMISGGAGINIVPETVQMHGEVRGHDALSREEVINSIRSILESAARQVSNSHGCTATIEMTSSTAYHAFVLDNLDPSVLLAEQAIRDAGGVPWRAVVNGGTDANWLTRRGIPTVSLGAGQVRAHTTNDAVDLVEYRQACRIAFRLATMKPIND